MSSGACGCQMTASAHPPLRCLADTVRSHARETFGSVQKRTIPSQHMSGYHGMRREADAEPYTPCKSVKMVEIARKQQIQLVNPA